MHRATSNSRGEAQQQSHTKEQTHGHHGPIPRTIGTMATTHLQSFLCVYVCARVSSLSSYRGTQPPPSRPASAAPRSSRPSLPFTGESQTHSDYRRPPPEAMTLTRRNGSDVFRSHFQQPADLYGGRGPGSYQTETAGQYTPKQLPTCPAAAWETPASTPGTRTPYNY